MSKRILITGSSGLLGTHSIEHYLQTTQWHLVLLSSLKHLGEYDWLKNLEGYDPDRITLIFHDLNAPFHDMLVERIGKVDAIINAASLTEVEDSIIDPVSFIRANTNAILHVVDLARKLKPGIFIQVSTNEVYGPTPVDERFNEESSYRPSNPYAASKASQEMICFSFWRTFDLPLVITNTMNNFGERQASHKFLPMTVRKVLNGEVNTVHARKNGGNWLSGSRVWLHAVNHANANKFIIDNIVPSPFQQGVLEPDRFNVAGADKISNAQVVKKVGEVTGKEPILEYLDFHSSRPGHDLHYALDGDKLRQAGWIPPISMASSFERVIEWLVSNPS